MQSEYLYRYKNAWCLKGVPTRDTCITEQAYSTTWHIKKKFVGMLITTVNDASDDVYVYIYYSACVSCCLPSGIISVFTCPLDAICPTLRPVAAPNDDDTMRMNHQSWGFAEVVNLCEWVFLLWAPFRTRKQIIAFCLSFFIHSSYIQIRNARKCRIPFNRYFSLIPIIALISFCYFPIADIPLRRFPVVALSDPKQTIW